MSYSPRSSDSPRTIERAGVVRRVERAEIVDPLPYPDELDGEPELDGDRDRNATSGAAVELRERDASDADGFAEQPRLLETVLASGRVHDEQRFVRRAVDPTLDDAPHLLELGHEVRSACAAGPLCRRSTTSRPRARAASTASNATAAGSAPRGAPTKSAPERAGPDLQLLLRGRAERVGRAHEHRAAMLGELARELADRRRLPGAVDADDQDHARLAVERERRRLAEERLDLLDERLLQVAGHAARLESADELCGRRHADVAGDQRLLEPLPRIVVRRVEGGRGELGRERTPALCERIAHAREESGLLRLVRLRDLVAEELGPGVAHAVAASCCWCCGSRRETTCDTPSGPIVTP